MATLCRVGAGAPILKRPTTPMSDILQKKPIHYVKNAHFVQNIVIRCVISS